VRVKEFQIRLVCQKVLDGLRAKGLIRLRLAEAQVMTRMIEIFVAELKLEDEINAEAEKILKQYESQMGGQIDRQKMFQMIKKQLAKDRGVVL